MLRQLRVTTPLAIPVLLLACGIPTVGGGSIPDDIPGWLSREIQSAREAPVTNPPAAFWSATFRNEVVYGRTSECCDAFTYIRSASGQVICAPSGGISGQGDGRCPDYHSAASNEQLIWRDARSWPSGR